MLFYASSCSLSSFSLTPFPPSTLVSSNSSFILSPSLRPGHFLRFRLCSTKSKEPDQAPDSNPIKKPNSKPRRLKSDIHHSKLSSTEDENSKNTILKTSQRKPRRGRKSEAAAVEDFVRDSLEKAIASIKAQNPDEMDDKPNILKEQHNGNDVEENEPGNDSDEESMVVEEDDSTWPPDADVGWGIRASEYFEKHSIKNVIGEDGVEINWEGETDEGLVKEITCLEWERFAFHPSPLIVLVFERYNRASENWKVLIELEKAATVFWRAKDRLPPRTIKIDINIERDLAYALKAKECPQILFLRGNRIMYREKEFRSADELVQMIAHFYYNAKKPSWIKKEAKSAT